MTYSKRQTLLRKREFDEERLNSQMDSKENAIITLTIIIICYFLAICIPDIGGVISITGATVNPFIGFLFPIFFWLKLES